MFLIQPMFVFKLNQLNVIQIIKSSVNKMAKLLTDEKFSVKKITELIQLKLNENTLPYKNIHEER